MTPPSVLRIEEYVHFSYKGFASQFETISRWFTGPHFPAKSQTQVCRQPGTDVRLQNIFVSSVFDTATFSSREWYKVFGAFQPTMLTRYRSCWPTKRDKCQVSVAKANALHTNFKQVMPREGGGQAEGKNRYWEKPNTNPTKNGMYTEKNGTIQCVFASLPMTASHVHWLLGLSFIFWLSKSSLSYILT